MMKPNIHPEYRTVVFHDTSVDEYFKIGSTIKTERFKAVQGRKKKRWFKIRRINDICLINNQIGLMLVCL